MSSPRPPLRAVGPGPVSRERRGGAGTRNRDRGWGRGGAGRVVCVCVCGGEPGRPAWGWQQSCGAAGRAAGGGSREAGRIPSAKGFQ